MLTFALFSILVFFHQTLGSDELGKLLKAHPTWSFKLVSVEALIKDKLPSLRSVDANLTEDVLRAKIGESFGPETTHIVTKIGDPNWSENPPAFFDAREKWPECAALINEVEDEGACFSDGAAVAAAVATDRYCIYTNGTFKDRLSHEMLTGCVELCTSSQRFFWSIESFRYLASHGIPTGGKFGSGKGCLPYESEPCLHTNEFYPPEDVGLETDNVVEKLKRCDEMMVFDHTCPTECSNSKYPIPLKQDLKKFTTQYIIQGNEFLIRREILEYGPIATSMMFFDDFFEHPKGIYWKKEDSNFVEWHKYFKLIGWGEENGTKYWIAINTWEGWGETKEFKVPRGINHNDEEFMLHAGVFGSIK